MVEQNRKAGKPRSIGIVVCLLFFAASVAVGLGPRGPRNHREAARLALIRWMDVYARNYAGADWSAVMDDLAAHPDAAGNAAVMSIPLTLGHVYLNRYEVGHDKADLDRAIGLFEQVASNHSLWGNRAGSGSVVSYLDISITRADGECDVGGFEARISDLRDSARAITAEEADALQAAGAFQSDEKTSDTENASRAALLAAAANFLADDSRAEQWDQGARQIASDLAASVCHAPEAVLALSQGDLSYGLVGREDPAEFASVLAADSAKSCPRLFLDYETTGPVAAVSPGDSLNLAIRDSRVVADRLSRVFLRLFPPRSQCVVIEQDPSDLSL